MFLRRKTKRFSSDHSTKKPKYFFQKKGWKISFLVLLSVLIIFGSYFAYLIASGKKIFDPTNLTRSSFFAKGSNYELKGEGDGRINILLLGYGGAGHDGAYLTDTIQILSIDPQNKKMAMLSIPRDFYAELKSPGYEGRINGIYSQGKPVLSNSKYNGADLSKQKVGDILDLPIHYYISMDFSGFKKAIDTVGGIDLNVDNSFTDYSYPADKGDGYLSPQKFVVGQQHLDGAKALVFARSRHAAGSEGSDFARSERQQKVLVAFKNKLLSNGTLANPVKVTSLVNVLSSSLRTDFQPNEIKALATLMKDVDTSNISSVVLDNSENGPLVSFTGADGASLLRPKAGITNYSDIQRIAHEIFTDPDLTKEDAKIEVLNGSSKAGLGIQLSDILKSYSYKVVNVDTSKEKFAKTVIYDYSNGTKKLTLLFLQKRLSAEVVKKSATKTGVDIDIIIGDNYQGFNKNP